MSFGCYISIDGKKKNIVYEGLPSICYVCGKVGHIKEKCNQYSNGQPMDKLTFSIGVSMKQNQNATGVKITPLTITTKETRKLITGTMEGEKDTNTKDQDIYDPWMQVTSCRSKKQLIVGANDGRLTSQHKETPTFQCFDTLSKLNQKDKLQTAADLSPNTV